VVLSAAQQERELRRAIEFLQGVETGKRTDEVYLEHFRKTPAAPPPAAEPDVSGPPPAAIFGFPLRGTLEDELRQDLDSLCDIDLDKPDPSLGVYGDSTDGHRVRRGPGFLY
jgi:hypothetical protein